MRKNNFLLLAFFLGIFWGPFLVSAQQADTLRSGRGQSQGGGSGDIIELGITEIKIKAEAPQVTLFNDRIKPEFDNVNLEKSFLKEVSGEGERFIFQEMSANEANEDLIDVEKMVTKLR